MHEFGRKLTAWKPRVSKHRKIAHFSSLQSWTTKTMLLSLSFCLGPHSLHSTPTLFVCQMRWNLVHITVTGWGGSDENIGLAEGQLAGAGRMGTELIECFVLRIPDSPPVPLVSAEIITTHPVSQAKCLKATFAAVFSLRFQRSSDCTLREWTPLLFF